nr:hypothetical protein [Tanacetum cinerariifolium]
MKYRVSDDDDLEGFKMQLTISNGKVDTLVITKGKKVTNKSREMCTPRPRNSPQSEPPPATTTTVAEKFFLRTFLANKKNSSRIPIYPIHNPPSPCTTMAAAAANITATSITLHSRHHLHHRNYPTFAAPHRCCNHHISTTPLPTPLTPTAAASHEFTTTAGTTATAATFPAATTVVVGCGWQIGHHRRDGTYKTPDFLGCPPPNHHRGGGRTTIQPPQPHLVVSSCDGATPWGVSQCSYFMHVVLIRGVDVYSDFPVFFTKRVVTIMVCRTEGFRPMVNTRTDAELAAVIQNALQTLLPQILADIREEFCTSSGPSGYGGNPPPVTIHTWLKCFNKQKPRSFEKATAPWTRRIGSLTWRKSLMSWVVRMHSRLDWLCTSLRVMHLLGGRPISKPKERLKREYHSLRQTDTETSAEFMQRFLRLAGFLREAAGTAKEQAKNFQWGLCKSTLNHLMCISFTDVSQVANAARNYEILHERDDDDAERPDKRQKSGDRHQPTTQQSSHRNHGHNNDRHGLDRRGGNDNHRSNNNYSGHNNMLNFKSIRSSSTHKHDPNITV